MFNTLEMRGLWSIISLAASHTWPQRTSYKLACQWEHDLNEWIEQGRTFSPISTTGREFIRDIDLIIADINMLMPKKDDDLMILNELETLRDELRGREAK